MEAQSRIHNCATQPHKANISAFLDAPNLEVGAPWEPQLLSAAEDAKHLIVLWSTTPGSPWVNREIGLFTARVDATTGCRPPDQLIIFVLLDGENTAYRSWQTIRRIKQGGLYAGGFPGVDHAEWRKCVVDDVIAAITNPDPRLPIPVAILAMTAAELGALDTNRNRTFADNLNQVLVNIAVPGVAELAPHYGALAARIGRPFGQHTRTASPISCGASKLRHEVALAGRLALLSLGVFRWTCCVWGTRLDRGRPRAAANRFLKGPSVVVVDPLSLHDDGVATGTPRHRSRILLQAPQVGDYRPNPVELPDVGRLPAPATPSDRAPILQ